MYVGSFIRGVDNVEESFYARAAELGVIDDVVVSGYVSSDHEVFGLFSEVHAFCYPLDEGLTARRSSVLTCVQSGRPLIVTGPALEDEFDHHPRFRELIQRGAIVLVARGSQDEIYADRIASALKWPTVHARVDFAGWWAGRGAGGGGRRAEGGGSVHTLASRPAGRGVARPPRARGGPPPFAPAPDGRNVRPLSPSPRGRPPQTASRPRKEQQGGGGHPPQRSKDTSAGLPKGAGRGRPGEWGDRARPENEDK